MNINQSYKELLKKILHEGDRVNTRNHDCISHIGGLQTTFNKFPLVTLRGTAWKKAIQEMEWFMSGEDKCPESLRDWWSGQLDTSNNYVAGYPHQLRSYSSYGFEEFDQVAFVLEALKNHKNSRRIVTTTWHPEEMNTITELNLNPNTPTTCHGTIAQFFVRNNKLSLHTYQRSADMLLGVPHNWVQYWALLLFFAYHSNLDIGSITWTFGDAHIYDDLSHINCVDQIITAKLPENFNDIELCYNYSGKADDDGLPSFRAYDFSIKGNVPEPITNIKPKLF